MQQLAANDKTRKLRYYIKNISLYPDCQAERFNADTSSASAPLLLLLLWLW